LGGVTENFGHLSEAFGLFGEKFALLTQTFGVFGESFAPFDETFGLVNTFFGLFDHLFGNLSVPLAKQAHKKKHRKAQNSTCGVTTV